MNQSTTFHPILVAPSSSRAKPLRYHLPCINQHLNEWTCDVVVFMYVDKACLSPSVAYSSCSSDPMHVFFNFVWHIIINNVHNIFNVQSPSCHSSSDKNGSSSRLKIVQGFLSFPLESVSM